MAKERVYTEVVQVWLTPEDKRKLVRFAEKSDSDTSKIVRSLIKKKLATIPNYE